jgi:hypothetical protein
MNEKKGNLDRVDLFAIGIDAFGFMLHSDIGNNTAPDHHVNHFGHHYCLQNDTRHNPIEHYINDDYYRFYRTLVGQTWRSAIRRTAHYFATVECGQLGYLLQSRPGNDLAGLSG